MLLKTIQRSFSLGFIFLTQTILGQAGLELETSKESPFPIVIKDQSISEVITTTPEFDHFHELLAKNTSLFSLLDEEGTWTVFIPTNTAFSGLNKKANLQLEMSQMILDKFLDWHISDKLITPKHIQLTGIYNISSYQNRFNFYIHCDHKNKIKMRNIPAVMEIKAKNGMIYAFDQMTIYPDVLNELNSGKLPVRFESE